MRSLHRRRSFRGSPLRGLCPAAPPPPNPWDRPLCPDSSFPAIIRAIAGSCWECGLMRNHRLDVQPIAGAMGAEVFGVDLSEELDEPTFGEVHQALPDHGAIFFRDQDVTPTQQMAFAQRWGSI